MKNVCLVFPGQGSQTVGMGQDFLHDSNCRALLGQAEEILGFSLGKIMMEERFLAELKLTQNAQPALLVCGLMALEYLKKQAGRDIAELAACVAGHSLGEYTAVGAAGGMTFETAVKLVRLRGEAMAESGVVGGMSAILGLTPDVAERVAEEAGVVFANDNTAEQAIFSGPIDKLEAAEEAAKLAGAKRALRLNVSGPFHTEMMQPAARKVAGFLFAHPLANLRIPCVMNSTAIFEKGAEQVRNRLVEQVTSRVRWRESMIHIADAGVTQVVELGVGKVLAGLAKRCDARLEAVSLEDRAGIDAWLEQTGSQGPGS